MATTYNDAIQQLYVAYFNRPADVGGLNFWESIVEASNGDTSAVSAAFASSDEYKSMYAGKSAYQIVAQIYQNLFGHAADVAGLNFYAGALMRGATTIDIIVKQIADGAHGSDATAFQDKVAAATQFTNSLDTTDKIIAYSGAAANQKAADFLTTVKDDASLAAAVSAANLDAVVQQMIDVNKPAGATLALTQGVDVLTGTSNDDTFNALPTTTDGMTLTSLDKIDGGAGNDTLNLVDTAAASHPVSISATVSVKNVETANLTSANNSISGNLSGWTGLTTANVTSVGGANITAAGTTVVNVTDGALAGNSVTVSGGSNVTVTANGINAAGGGITVSGATGDVNVTANEQAATGFTAGAISVTGGKTVTVTQSATASASSSATALTQAAVNVTGDANTTAVTVNQTAAAAAGAAGNKEVFTATFTAGATNGDTTTFDGQTYVAGATLSAVATASAFVTYYNAQAGANYVAVDNGDGTVTFTAKTAGVVADNTNASFVESGGATTAVTVAAPTTQGTIKSQQVVDGAVTIADANAGSATAAATIATVTLSNYGTSSVSSNALATLNLSGTSGALTLTSGLTTETVTTLNLNVNNLSGNATVNDSSNHYTTVNVATSGKDSALTLVDTAATTLNVSGTNALNLTATNGNLTGLKTITVTGSASLNSDVHTLANLTSVDASGTSGNNTVTLDATKAAYKGGSGVDTVTITAAPTQTIDGGAGTNDVLVVNAGTDILNGNTKVTGFETLGLGAAATGSYNANNFSHLSIGGTTTGNVTFANVAANADLSISGATGHSVTYTLLNSLGSSDTLNLKLSAAANVANNVTAGGVENVTINLADTNTTSGHAAFGETLTLSASAASTITVTGNGSLGLTLTDTTDTGITTVDASALTVAGGAANTGLVWTAGALTNDVTIKGSVNGGDYIDVSSSTKTATITLNGGTNSVTGTGGADHITAGNGSNTIVAGAGNDVISVGSGANTITGGAGADMITLAAHAGKVDVIKVAAAGDSGANNATVTQTSELANTFDVVKGIAAGDQINLHSVAALANVATADLSVSGANLAAVNDKVVFVTGTYDANAGTFTFAANGTDTAVTYDTTAGATVTAETIILVGFHADAAHTTATGGIITLA